MQYIIYFSISTPAFFQNRNSLNIIKLYFPVPFLVSWGTHLVLQPKVVTDTDEIELSKQLAALEKMNAEVGGDDSPDEMPSDEDEPEQWFLDRTSVKIRFRNERSEPTLFIRRIDGIGRIYETFSNRFDVKWCNEKGKNILPKKWLFFRFLFSVIPSRVYWDFETRCEN